MNPKTDEDSVTLQEHMEVVHSETLQHILKHVSAGIEPLAIAGIYAALALKIYRTVMEDDDYYAMVNALSENSSRVEPFPNKLPNHKLN